MITKSASHYAPCTICGSLGVYEVLSTSDGSDPSYSNVYCFSLCVSTENQRAKPVIICDSDICFNMAILNPNFLWN